MTTLEQVAALVEQGKTDAASKYPRALIGQPGVRECVRELIAEGMDPLRILNEALTPGIRALGKKFSEGTVFVPELLLAAKAMKAGVEEVMPHLQAGDIKTRGTVLLGTVQGDIHDIGKNLVKMLLEGVGWKIVDLGANVPSANFVTSALEHKPDAIGLSALLTTTMETMRDVVAQLRDAGVNAPVLVGGAPLSHAFASEINAHYGQDPQAAIDILDRLLPATA